MFLFCQWQGKRVDCDKLVKKTKTDSGFCCSFNTMDLNDEIEWSDEDVEEEIKDYDYDEDINYEDTGDEVTTHTDSIDRWATDTIIIMEFICSQILFS